MPDILYIEDKLGVTEGYEDIFTCVCVSGGILPTSITRFSFYKGKGFGSKIPVEVRGRLLVSHGNRKAPAYNSDPKVKAVVEQTIRDVVASLGIKLVICADPGSLGILNIPQDIATLDNLRGGVYHPEIIDRKPFLVTLPISAWHSKIKEKDLSAANDGFESKEDWEAAHTSADGEAINSDIDADARLYYEPLVVPYGRFVLQADMKKANRIYQTL